MIEVRERMKNTIDQIIKKNLGHKVAIVSHGAAIKFYLSQWCEVKENMLFYNNTEIKVGSPSIIKLTMCGMSIENIEEIMTN